MKQYILIIIFILLFIILAYSYTKYYTKYEGINLGDVERAIKDVGNYGKQIGTLFNEIDDAFKEVGNLGNDITNLGNDIADAMEYPVQIVAGIPNQVSGVFDQAENLIMGVFDDVFDEIMGFVNDLGSFATDIFDQIFIKSISSIHTVVIHHHPLIFGIFERERERERDFRKIVKT